MEPMGTHRLHSSSSLGLPSRTLHINPQKELLGEPFVNYIDPVFVEPLSGVIYRLVSIPHLKELESTTWYYDV